MYVHAGGKIEALGTGLWAAPRGSAGELAETSGATGLMTVETVCAVDVRDNTLPPSGLGDSTMSPRQGGSTMAGTALVSVTSSGGSLIGSETVKKDKKTEERDRKEAERLAKLAEKDSRKTQVPLLSQC